MPNSTNKKLIRQLLICAIFVIMLTSIGSCVVLYFTVKAENQVRYAGIMNLVSAKVSTTIRSMEVSAMNVFDELGKHMTSPDDVTSALNQKTLLNPDVSGYFAAFKPDYFPEKGKWFEPYIHQTDSNTKFVLSQVGSASHDYTRSSWYTRAHEIKESFWSDPYYYYDGTSLSGNYCTFVMPVTDATGEIACVCGADMTFTWITRELERIDREVKHDDMRSLYLLDQDDEFYSVILNRDGSCIAHPLEKMLPIKEANIYDDLREGRTGMGKVMINGSAYAVYYGPVEHVDWSVAIVVPYYNTLGYYLWPILSVLGIAALSIGILCIFYRRAKEE